MPGEQRAPGTGARSSKARFEWMDTLRGSAILLMLLWHATSIPSLDTGIAIPTALLAVNNFFLPFRMPTLMFLSGMLLARSLQKPLPDYYWGKARLLVWPYLVWVVIIRSLDGTSSMLLNPTTYIATSYLWFLFYVAAYYAIAPLLGWLPRWIPPVGFLGAAFLVDQAQLHRLLYFAVFFFAGHWASAHKQQILDLVGRTAVLVGLAVGAVGLGILSANVDVAYTPATVPLSLAGILVGIRVAQPLSSHATRLVRAVGRTSIVYYTAHFPVMVVTLAAATALGVAYPGVSLILLAAGVAAGALFSRYKTAPPVRWLFEAPVPTTVPAFIRRTSRIPRVSS